VISSEKGLGNNQSTDLQLLRPCLETMVIKGCAAFLVCTFE